MDYKESPKSYPSTTPEVAKLLGLPAAGDLPVAQKPEIPVTDQETPDSHGKQSADAHAPADAKADSHGAKAPAAFGQNQTQSPYAKAVKTFLPYAAIFIVALFLYYFFFSSVNFNVNLGNLAASVSDLAMPSSTTPASAAAPQQTALQQLQLQDMSGYSAWIQGFYYDVTDPKIIDPNADNSGNGLNNFQKYLLNLNPKSYDSLGLGLADSQELSQGINPLSGQALTSSQQNIINKYIDMEAVMNRLALEQMQNPGRVAGASVTGNYPGGNPVNPIVTPVVPSAPVGGGGSGPVAPRGQPGSASMNIQETEVTPAENNLSSGGSGLLTDQSVDINTAIPGLLEVPDLKISAPIMWTQDPANFDQDLESGVVHYPGTAMPGEIGTTYIAGHSSNYIWAKGDYNHVFTHLGDLGNDASFQITVTDMQGQKVVYHYVVVGSKQYSPTDQAQFANTGNSLVALSTCWPVGSTSKRLVLFGQLTQVEK